MKAYRFLAEADSEFREQIRYYDEQVPGLGAKFIADVESIITQIRRHPESGARVSRNLRKRVLTVFNFGLFIEDLLTGPGGRSCGVIREAGDGVPLMDGHEFAT